MNIYFPAMLLRNHDVAQENLNPMRQHNKLFDNANAC